ncbi:MAG: DUF2029 domain-containing protein [Candidatus Methylarchaceae archaeon HK01B]|nr:DUF2029 domain-containing protein [Candidatus Methylarchaceae archaeon HK01B]
MKRPRITPIRLLLIVYSIILAIVYFIPSIPLELGNEWYSFYDYLNANGAIPYIDYREGYPPIGFLLYYIIYSITGQSELLFTYGFRALNLVLLIGTLYLLYAIIKITHGEKKALLTSLIFALLPSVAITNAYSNDVIALFFSAFAIYYLIQKRPGLAGLMIGLGAMSKGFPLLLLIPAFFYFDRWQERYRLLRASAFIMLIISLPFFVFDTFTYFSTFVHHGTRGPWETIWALIDGWYGHGGFLHPAFDQFFYHFDLLNMYNLSPYDHVFYLWTYPWLPSLLTIAPIALIMFGVFIFKGKKQYLLQFIGFTYFSYMLFFKGYSTQFSVTSPFYVLISLGSYVVPFILVLESSQMLQWLAWNPGGSDQHQILLLSSIIIRTVFFVAMLYQTSHAAFSFTRGKRPLRQILTRIPLVPTLRRAWKPAILATLSIIILIVLVISLQGSVKFNDMGTKNLELSLQSPAYVSLGDLAKDDRIMLKLETRTEVLVRTISSPETKTLERGNINPPSLRGYFDDTRYFFMADYNSDYTLELSMVTPSIPFRITDGLYGDADVNISTIQGDVGPMLNITIEDRGEDGKNTLFRLAYPVDEVVDEDFEVRLSLRLDKGDLSEILFDVFDVKDDWLYTFDIPFNNEEGGWILFKLDKDSRDTYGSRDLVGDRISQLAISLLIDDGKEVNVIIGNFEIQGNSGLIKPPLSAADSEEISYTIYRASKYHLEILHMMLWLGLIVCIIALDRELRILFL